MESSELGIFPNGLAITSRAEHNYNSMGHRRGCVLDNSMKKYRLSSTQQCWKSLRIFDSHTSEPIFYQSTIYRNTAKHTGKQHYGKIHELGLRRHSDFPSTVMWESEKYYCAKPPLVKAKLESFLFQHKYLRPFFQDESWRKMHV